MQRVTLPVTGCCRCTCWDWARGKGLSEPDGLVDLELVDLKALCLGLADEPAEPAPLPTGPTEPLRAAPQLALGPPAAPRHKKARSKVSLMPPDFREKQESIARVLTNHCENQCAVSELWSFCWCL